MTRTTIRYFFLVCATVAAACGGPSIAEHIERADRFVADARLNEAEIEYRAALQADPNRGDVRLKLADVYLKLQQPSKALGEFVRAADLLPDNRDAQRQAGILLLAAGQFEDAKTRAEKALALDPKDVDAQILLGNALGMLRDFDGALREYQDALVLSPADDRAYRNMAAIQIARGKAADAEAAFRKAVEVAPRSLAAHLSLGGFYWSTGRIADAERVFKDALALDPKNPAANRALGTFYVGSNRVAEAEPYFKAIAEAAQTTAARIGLADYYLIAGRRPEARAILADAVKDPAVYRDAAVRLAAMDLDDGQRAAAEQKLRDVLGKQPNDLPVQLFLARLLLLGGKRDDSLKMAEAIVAHDAEAPAAAGAYALIGSIQASLDRPEDAIKSFNEAVKRDRRPVGALVALARLHRQRGEFDKAASLARDALKLQPGAAMARVELVRVLISQQQLAGARAELATLRKEFPNAPAVLTLVGAQQFAERQYAAARASYAKAAAAAPNDIEALAGLVLVDLATSNIAEATGRVDAALKSLPPNGDLYVLAARAYLAVRNTAKAEELLRKAIDTDPTRLSAYNLLGLLYVREKRLDEAERNFREVTTRNPSSVPAHTMLAMILDAQRRTADAEAQYKQVLALDAQAPVAANNLAWIYVSSNRNISEAAELSRLANRRLPEEPNIADTLGWVLYRQGQYREAVTHLERSVKTDPNPVNQYHLGMAYVAWGEPEKGRAMLTAAVASKTPFDGIEDARKALDSLPK